MARKKRGLQKSVDSIFEGVALQDVIRQGLPRDLNQQEKAPQEEQAPTDKCLICVWFFICPSVGQCAGAQDNGRSS